MIMRLNEEILRINQLMVVEQDNDYRLKSYVRTWYNYYRPKVLSNLNHMGVDTKPYMGLDNLEDIPKILKKYNYSLSNDVKSFLEDAGDLFDNIGETKIEKHQDIKMNEIPNNLIPFSNEEIKQVENFISKMGNFSNIVLTREDDPSDRWPRLVISMDYVARNGNPRESLLFLYKSEDGNYYGAQRTVISKGMHFETDNPQGAFMVNSLNDLEHMNRLIDFFKEEPSY